MTNKKAENRDVICGILQPGYLPWLGFFEQIARSDNFILYDDVQYNKGGWRNRNRVKTAQGATWLTVPILTNMTNPPKINEVKINNSVNWRKKHLKTVEMSYSKSPFFKTYFPLFEEGFSINWEKLIDVDLWFIKKIATALGINIEKIQLSSELNINGGKIERLINICHHFGANIFYEGAAGADYLKEEDFEKHGVKLLFQEYNCSEYQQLFGEFVPFLSVIDLLFNQGDASLKILMNGGR